MVGLAQPLSQRLNSAGAHPRLCSLVVVGAIVIYEPHGQLKARREPSSII